MSNPTCSHYRCLALLREATGIPEARFHPGQFEAISSVVADRKRLLVVQRTGWGKSMVYFLATKILRESGAGPTLLISPLLALMRDQIRAARRLGVRAETLNSSNMDNWTQIRADLGKDAVDLLLISPEKLANQAFLDRDLSPVLERVGLLVVDEAHCISDWGHDFRPDYRRIVRLLNLLPTNIPVLATTATANNRVVEDVVEQIGNLDISRGPLTRSSLRLQNIQLPHQAARMAWLAEYVPAIPGSGIIYVLTKRDAARVTEWLQGAGIEALAYTSDSEGREHLEEELLGNKVKALVATTALSMGFDKPDLGFVIHFQAPQSAVHYYQQVGRAGRAVDNAYGVLLSGVEDDDINQYFINSAYPPERDVVAILKALEEADNGLLIEDLEQEVNLRRGQIWKILKILSVEDNPPVQKQGYRWFRTPHSFRVDHERINRLTSRRQIEWKEMQNYLAQEDCLMQFLARALDDGTCEPCGKCASCLGEEIIPAEVADSTVQRAIEFLNRSDLPLLPRKKWALEGFAEYEWTGIIANDLRNEEGRTLARWGDVGWGKLVRDGKHAGSFEDTLVTAAKELIEERWAPNPGPQWVTCVASIKHPVIVPDFARRLAEALGLPFVDCVQKFRSTEPQKSMQNSYQQARNLDGAFKVREDLVLPGSVLLVDDLVDSRWTLTVIGALLREAGSGAVYPIALASTATG